MRTHSAAAEATADNLQKWGKPVGDVVAVISCGSWKKLEVSRREAVEVKRRSDGGSER